MPLFFSRKRHVQNANSGTSAKPIGNTVDLVQSETTMSPIDYCYKNKPIDSRSKQIRLLKVLAGHPRTPIRCEMHDTFLDPSRRCQYETVSYRWGDDRSKAVIYIDGIAIKTTASAARVLLQFRLQEQDRMLWIDAICIDQTSETENQPRPTEKDQQVAIMGDIYRCSQNNLIWLGSDRGDSYRTFNAMQAVLENIDRQAGLPSNFHDMMNEPTHLANRDNMFLDKTIDFPPLIELFSSPWWQRVWVAQEAVLAPQNECHFGDMIMPFPKVLNIAAWLNYNLIQLPGEFASHPARNAAASMYRLMSNKHRRYNDLFAIYTYLQDFKATDPRDYVYAMLGLYKRQTEAAWIGDLVRPDYKKPVDDVFRDATRHMILDGGHLSVLHFIDNRYTSRSFPSWAVRFDHKTVNDHDPVCRLMKFDASNLGPKIDTPNGHRGYFTPYKSPHPHILGLGGLHVADIRDCSAALGGEGSWKSGNQAKILDNVILMAKSRSSSGSQNWERELAHTLISGTSWRHGQVGSEEIEGFKAFLKHLRKDPTRPPFPQAGRREDERNRLASRWLVAFEKATRNRRFFITTDGRMGLGPANLEPGNGVAILFGGNVPFVLRRRGGYHALVGECYVHGIMHGEFVRDRRIAKPDAIDDFFLC